MSIINEITNAIISNPGISALLIPAVCFVSKAINRKAKLNNFSKVSNAKAIKLPPELIEQIDSFDEEEILKGLNENIVTFYNRLVDKIPEDKLVTLRNNIRTISIEDKTKDAKFKSKPATMDAGLYFPSKNMIYIYDGTYLISLFHELMHMASSVKKDNFIYSGLVQRYEDGVCIGTGLNEGVTQMLTIIFW